VARILYEFCFLQYDTQEFIGELDNCNCVIYANVGNVNGDSTFFEKVLGDLTDKITGEALDFKSKIGFAKGQTKLSEFETLYSLVQCIRGLSKFACSQCLATAIGNYAGSCTDKKGYRSIYRGATARVSPFWFFGSALRYDTQKFVGELDTSGGLIYYNVENVTGDAAVFEKVLGDLTDKVTREALDRRNRIGFGKGQIKLSPFETLYTQVQCTRDLSKLACSQCLATAVGNYAGYCKDKKGCRAIYSSCFVRYELYPIFFPVSSVNTTAQNVYSRH
ncbi:hypothetical protein C5167_040181, partial [Papaver somniferum]